jgi:leucine dehydrogenase
MKVVELPTRSEHELVLQASDESAGYHAYIAVHSTALGPAVGGTRLWHYESDAAALTDALRLARGMTFKNAMARLPLGGGKSVLVANGGVADRDALFRAHGRVVESLGGKYFTAEDVGTSPTDMAIMQQTTRYVAGLADRSGDPSPVTAHGVFRAIQASAHWKWGSDDLTGKTVAVQGAGHVGYYLCRELQEAGAELVITDIDTERVRRVVTELGARAVEPGEIYGVRADIFAPCALGAVLNDATIPQLEVEIVAGAANNQLLEERHGDMLEERGILYAPDYVANAGGVINGSRELLGMPEDEVRERVERIYDSVTEVFERARAWKVSPAVAADRVAENRLRSGTE